MRVNKKSLKWQFFRGLVFGMIAALISKYLLGI